ncbi:unnamed protein product, partial [Owenia fusiformis]
SISHAVFRGWRNLENIAIHPGLNAEGLKWYLRLAHTWKDAVGVKVWAGPFQAIVAIFNHLSIRDILNTDTTEKPMIIPGYEIVVPWIGHGLLTSNGPKWFRNRRLLTPAFHFGVLKPYVKIYNEVATILSTNLNRNCDTGKSFDVTELIGLATLDSLLRCLVSYEDDAIQQTKGIHPYVYALEELGRLSIKRAFNIFHYSDTIYNLSSDGRLFRKYCDYVHQFAEDLIKQRRDAQMLEASTEGESTKKHLDFLDIMLSARDDDSNGLSDEEIRHQVDTFLFAGHDTTTSAVCWTLHSLAGNQVWQDKVREEVSNILASTGSDEITWEDVGKLTTLSLVVKEVLRMHTPAVAISRIVKEKMMVNGVEILPDTLLDLRLYTLHHNKKTWGDDAMEFKPERFLTKEVQQLDPFAYVPFSAGSRNCIGKNFALNELKVITARLIHKFRFEIDEDNQPIYKPEIVMRSENGFHLFIHSAN